MQFLYNGVTSACFKHDGKIQDFMELMILSQMKFKNISEFSLIILVGMSEYWDVFVSIYLKLISLKLKTPLHLVLIARMLGCFLWQRSFVIKGIWLPLACFALHGAYLSSILRVYCKTFQTHNLHWQTSVDMNFLISFPKKLHSKSACKTYNL